MNKKVRYTLNGNPIDALPDETIWLSAKRHGKTIPHLCYSEAPDYRPDGNCRV